MKKKIYALTGFMLVIAAFYAYWQVSFILPKTIELYTVNAARSILGESATFDYARKESGLTHIVFHEIKLDEDGFSRVEKIEIRYSPLGLFFTGIIDNIKILVPDITLSVDEGSLHDNVQRFLSLPAPAWLHLSDILDIEGGRLTLLTRNMGSLRIGFAGIVRTGENKDKAAQFQIEAAQKQLSGDLKLGATIAPGGNWHIDATLDDGRLDHDLLQLTRMSGQMALDSAGDTAFYAKSEFNIGGMRLPSGHALSDIAASYELDQNGFEFLVGGKALGFDDIELGFSYNSQKPAIYTGTIFTPSIPELVRYYKGERGILTGVHENRLIQDIFLTYELPVDSLWATEKIILLQFNRLNIADFTPVFSGNFYGNGQLRGAAKIQISPDSVTIGGMALDSRNGNFVFEEPLLGALSEKISPNPQSESFLAKAGDYHYETLSMSLSGADEQSGERQVAITLEGRDGSAPRTAETEFHTFVFKDDLVWLWDALLGKPQD